MFTLLNPAALLALTGLLVPVAIHLWNRRPGREVAVGSLRWLAAGANRRLRNLRPEQLGLLLLRAGLLAALAVAGAGPVWRQREPAGRGVVLLSPEALGAPALAVLRPTIDSLRRRGYALRWLAKGFARVPGAAGRTKASDRSGTAADSAARPEATSFPWARARQAVAAFPGQPLFVVTTAALRDFQGAHPPLPASVTWQTLPRATAESWVQAAAFRGDSLRLLVGRSTATQTTFRPVAVARPRPGGVVRLAGLPALRLAGGASGARLQPLNPENNPAETAAATVPVRTRPLRVIMYATADYAPDARYLRAGLRAAATGLPVALEISSASGPPNPGTPPDWLFWLTDAPLPTAWRAAVSGGTQVWQEAAGPGVAAPATLAAEAPNEAAVALFRRANAPAAFVPEAGRSPVWTDGQGRTVLSRRGLGRGAIYQLHTRLNPAWSEIADSPVLPARLLALLQPEPTDDLPATAPPFQALGAHDQRALDPTQFPLAEAGGKAPAAGPAGPRAFHSTDWRPWLVLLAGLLFALERRLAFRREARSLTPLP